MQSKPGAKKVVYLTSQRFQHTDRSPLRLGWSMYANKYDTDGKKINNFIGTGLGRGGLRTINFPDQNVPELLIIAEGIAKKFEIFDINVTTLRSVYDAASVKDRVLCYIFYWPLSNEFNNSKADLSENGSLPYSWRRWLLGHFDPDPDRYPLLYPPSWMGLAPALSLSLMKQLNTDIICFARREISRMRWDPTNGNSLGGGNERTILPIADTIGSASHEIAHCFDLSHDTNGGNPSYNNFDSYYNGHNEWGPIMGNPIEQFGRTMIQWSTNDESMKSGYPTNTNSEDDILKIASESAFIKAVAKKYKDGGFILAPLIKERIRLFTEDCWDKGNNKFGYNVRVISTQGDLRQINNTTVIDGMIGFPFDFDLIKIVLPKGYYTFAINSVQNDKYSMFDPQIDVINCHCNKSKEDWNVSCNQEELPTVYPEDATTQCIAYDPCISESEYQRSKEWGIDDGQLPVITSSIYLPYKSIIYLRIRGAKNLTPAVGWGRYGSVGKYRLQIRKDNGVLPFSDFTSPDPLPECHCEEFYYCKDGNYEKILLYVQDEAESRGTQNQAGPHIKEISAIINGETKKKKFLVNGMSIGMDEPEEDGKFYLPIIEFGQCRKQEFIVGQDWEKKKES